MFAIAQIMYIFAFGFKPLNLKLGAVLYLSCSIGKIHRAPVIGIVHFFLID